MFRKKGQAAMEFLMTYGWAILVVLVAIGALAYFGVLSPDKFLPERCTGPAGLDCIDKASVSVDGDSVTFVIKNNLGFNIAFGGATTATSTLDCTFRNANVSIDNTTATVQRDITPGAETPVVLNAGQATITIGCSSGLSSGRFKSDIGVPYTNLNSGLKHTATFGITGVAS